MRCWIQVILICGYSIFLGKAKTEASESCSQGTVGCVETVSSYPLCQTDSKDSHNPVAPSLQRSRILDAHRNGRADPMEMQMVLSDHEGQRGAVPDSELRSAMETMLGSNVRFPATQAARVDMAATSFAVPLETDLGWEGFQVSRTQSQAERKEGKERQRKGPRQGQGAREVQGWSSRIAFRRPWISVCAVAFQLSHAVLWTNANPSCLADERQQAGRASTFDIIECRQGLHGGDQDGVPGPLQGSCGFERGLRKNRGSDYEKPHWGNAQDNYGIGQNATRTPAADRGQGASQAIVAPTPGSLCAELESPTGGVRKGSIQLWGKDPASYGRASCFAQTPAEAQCPGSYYCHWIQHHSHDARSDIRLLRPHARCAWKRRRSFAARCSQSWRIASRQCTPRSHESKLK